MIARGLSGATRWLTRGSREVSEMETSDIDLGPASSQWPVTVAVAHTFI